VTCHYTISVSRGGAMFDECRALLREWEPGMDYATFRQVAIERNLLGKATRTRVAEVLQRAFLPRFLSSKVPPAQAARKLILAGAPEEVIRRVIFYHAALADDLLYDFVTLELFPLWQSGRVWVETADGQAFVEELMAQGKLRAEWSPYVRMKVGRGLLTYCREGGILRGTVKKRFAPIHLPFAVFIYVAYHLKSKVASSARIVAHPDWRLFLLDEDGVERLFLDAHQREYLGYHAAGGVRRIDWRYPDLLAAVDALVERADTGA